MYHGECPGRFNDLVALIKTCPAKGKCWQARRESNPQPAVLETAALPIELLAYFLVCCTGHNAGKTGCSAFFLKITKPKHLLRCFGLVFITVSKTYSIILATTPAPTVRPPSRIANRNPSSIAIGAINVTSIFTLSPGITISTPSGNSQEPVTSVVRK